MLTSTVLTSTECQEFKAANSGFQDDYSGATAGLYSFDVNHFDVSVDGMPFGCQWYVDPAAPNNNRFLYNSASSDRNNERNGGGGGWLSRSYSLRVCKGGRSPPSPPPSPPRPTMDWKWPAEHSVDCKDYHPRIGGGQEEVGGWGRGTYTNTFQLAKACDPSDAGWGFQADTSTANGYGVSGADYVDFIFTFDEANTWCSGYRQSGPSSFPVTTFTKDIEIYTGDANFGPWTKVATDSHSTWHNGGTPTFLDDGTTTEWTPTAPSKYLLVRTLTNHGDSLWSAGGRLAVRYIQLKFSAPPN